MQIFLQKGKFFPKIPEKYPYFAYSTLNFSIKIYFNISIQIGWMWIKCKLFLVLLMIGISITHHVINK